VRQAAEEIARIAGYHQMLEEPLDRLGAFLERSKGGQP
jgi:hypothetical protein